MKKLNDTALGALILGLLALALLTEGCRKQPLAEGLPLEFSVDTLHFDTVFTAMGSATRRFTIRNPHRSPLRIDRLRLAGGSASDYRLNVDGLSGPEATNLEIPAGDSLHVFATVLINPAVGDAVRMDSILFETGTYRQTVYLSAYGWNAVYIGRVGFLTRFVNADLRFTTEKPYILFGLVAIDSFSTLRIDPGAKIFMFGGPSTRPGDRALLYIGDNSTLESGIGGSIDNPVQFRTHRLEEDYQPVPFQHGGIYLSQFSRDNRIHNTIIRNAVDGIIVDSLSVNGNPKLELKQSKIYDVDRSCILSRQGSIRAENCLLANSNRFVLLTLRGGQHEFSHCTIVNYATTVFLSRKEAVLSLRDFEIVVDADGNEIALVADGSNRFENCVIYGTRREEIQSLRAQGSTAQWSLAFNTCAVRIDTFSQGLNDCLINQDPRFKSPEEYDYSPASSDSPLVDAGLLLGLLQDLRGQSRDARPDIGAYEWQP